MVMGFDSRSYRCANAIKAREYIYKCPSNIHTYVYMH